MCSYLLVDFTEAGNSSSRLELGMGQKSQDRGYGTEVTGRRTALPQVAGSQWSSPLPPTPSRKLVSGDGAGKQTQTLLGEVSILPCCVKQYCL